MFLVSLFFEALYLLWFVFCVSTIKVLKMLVFPSFLGVFSGVAYYCSSGFGRFRCFGVFFVFGFVFLCCFCFCFVCFVIGFVVGCCCFFSFFLFCFFWRV